MRTGYLRSITAQWLAVLLFSTPLATGQETPYTAASDALRAEESMMLAETEFGAPAAADAQEYLRRGVALYKRDLYREALTEFNRALALDPTLEEARAFQEKCNSKLQLSAAQQGPSEIATFETFDPESLPGPGETPPLSAEEIKRERVKVLLRDARRYLEADRFQEAVSIYSNVLLIDPNNQEARKGLHRATLGAREDSMRESRLVVKEDRAMIRDFIEQQKRLPEGADATGIKQFRLAVPEIEEEYAPAAVKSEIERTLESPVSVEFEDIHINDIVEFIADSWGINIVIDLRAVEPPRKPQPATTPGPPAPGAPMPGAFPQAAPYTPQGQFRPGQFQQQQPRLGIGQQQQMTAFGAPAQPGMTGVQVSGATQDAYYGFKSDGIVPYINLKNVTLAEALQALLRPLGLDYSVQPGFIWISKPEIIRQETFEPLETRYYELRNAGAETLFKIVLRNTFGAVGGGVGAYGGGVGAYGGGIGGYGGGIYGGIGGYGGGYGGYGGAGGYRGGYGGGYGGRGGFRQTASFDAESFAQYGGYGGGFGGGGGDVTAISNISDLFTTIPDQMVGESPATIGALGLNNTGTGIQGRGMGAGYQTAQFQQQQQLGGFTTQSGMSVLDSLDILLQSLPDVYEPYTGEVLSSKFYNTATNVLVVKNTKSNLDEFEKMLAEVDVTPKQVSIEAKFVTVRVDDLDKIGFEWNAKLSDLNNRAREIPGLQNYTYDYDINADGVDEPVPFYSRPDGSNVIRNTITEGTLAGLVNPAAAGALPTFQFASKILQNRDGDSLGVAFDFLDSLTESELLSAPRVTTMNRKPAVIADFATEYFVASINTQVFTSEAGFGGTPVTSYVQNITPVSFNFGIAFSVTPQIRDNDQVRLWLNPEVRTRTGEKSFTQKSIVNDNTVESVINLPSTSWQAVWTNVIVHDGDTLVLGGLVQDKSSHTQHKLPYIADIPVIGFFFKGKSREVKQSSLLIFVTPTIVDATGARFFDITASSGNRPIAIGAGG